jgi:hypothetical protein
VKRSEFLSYSLCLFRSARLRVFLALARSKAPSGDNPPNFLVSFLKHPTIWASQTSPLLDSLLAAGKSSCCVSWRAESPYFPLPISSHAQRVLFSLSSPFFHFSFYLSDAEPRARAQSGRFAEGPRRAARRTFSPIITPFIFVQISDLRSRQGN